MCLATPCLLIGKFSPFTFEVVRDGLTCLLFSDCFVILFFFYVLLAPFVISSILYSVCVNPLVFILCLFTIDHVGHEVKKYRKTPCTLSPVCPSGNASQKC